jgi:hypothetical protein
LTVEAIIEIEEDQRLDSAQNHLKTDPYAENVNAGIKSVESPTRSIKRY